MKRVLSIVFLVAGTILTVICGFYSLGFLSAFLFSKNEDSSIGIIGGADGPTAIFIGSRIALSPLIAIIGTAVGVAVIVISVIAIRKNKSKK